LKNSWKKICCPYTKEQLAISENSLVSRKFTYDIVNGVPNLISEGQIEEVVKGEITGNSFVETQEEKIHYANKFETEQEHVGIYYTERDLDSIVPILKDLDHSSVLFLGVGGGMEVRRILRRGLKIEQAYCSDLVVSKCQVVPMTLKEFDIDIGVFASDMSYIP